MPPVPVARLGGWPPAPGPAWAAIADRLGGPAGEAAVLVDLPRTAGPGPAPGGGADQRRLLVALRRSDLEQGDLSRTVAVTYPCGA